MKCFESHKNARMFDVIISNAEGSDKILTNPEVTTLYMAETCMILSPGVSPIVRSNRARMFGDLGYLLPGPQGCLTRS